MGWEEKFSWLLPENPTHVDSIYGEFNKIGHNDFQFDLDFISQPDFNKLKAYMFPENESTDFYDLSESRQSVLMLTCLRKAVGNANNILRPLGATAGRGKYDTIEVVVDEHKFYEKYPNKEDIEKLMSDMSNIYA